AALSRVEEGLSDYPRDPRLIQVHDTLERDLLLQKKQARRRDLEELRRMDNEANSASDAMKQTWGERARALADKYQEDNEVFSSANGVLQKLNLPAVSSTEKVPTPLPGQESATLSYVAPTMKVKSPPEVPPTSQNPLLAKTILHVPAP